MAIRKNKKRIDPRYFLHETADRDLDEQEQLVVSLDDLSQLGGPHHYSRLQQKVGGHPVLKVPGQNDFYRLRNVSVRGTESTNFGYILDYATVPDMGTSMIVGKIEPGSREATDVGAWLANALSKKTDKVEVIPPK